MEYLNNGMCIVPKSDSHVKCFYYICHDSLLLITLINIILFLSSDAILVDKYNFIDVKKVIVVIKTRLSDTALKCKGQDT